MSKSIELTEKEYEDIAYILNSIMFDKETAPEKRFIDAVVAADPDFIRQSRFFGFDQKIILTVVNAATQILIGETFDPMNKDAETNDENEDNYSNDPLADFALKAGKSYPQWLEDNPEIIIPSKGLSFLKFNLSDEDYEEIVAIIERDVFGIRPDRLFIDEIIYGDMTIAMMGVVVGFDDQEIKESILNECSHLLSGEPWPILKDNVDMVDFESKTVAAYEKWVEDRSFSE